MKDNSGLSLDDIDEAAVGRFVRLIAADARAADWERFIDWLEADPLHVKAYNAVIEADGTAGKIGSASPVFAEIEADYGAAPNRRRPGSADL